MDFLPPKQSQWHPSTTIVSLNFPPKQDTATHRCPFSRHYRMSQDFILTQPCKGPVHGNWPCWSNLDPGTYLHREARNKLDGHMENRLVEWTVKRSLQGPSPVDFNESTRLTMFSHTSPGSHVRSQISVSPALRVTTLKMERRVQTSNYTSCTHQRLSIHCSKPRLELYTSNLVSTIGGKWH